MPQYPLVMSPERAAKLYGIEVMEPPPTVPPVNVDVPHVSLTNGPGGVGSTYICTKGTWENMGDLVDTYAYRWQRNGAPITIGANLEEYTAVAADRGTALGCIVTATNTIGSTAAPLSNTINLP
jgi:hypothetical protein